MRTSESGRCDHQDPDKYAIQFPMQNTLQAEGFDDDAALDETIKKLELDVKRSRKKEADGQDDAIVSPVHHRHHRFLLTHDFRRNLHSLSSMFLMQM